MAFLLADPWANARADGAVLLCVTVAGIVARPPVNRAVRPVELRYE
ncbi:hypothetical protein [Embleya sp. NBC_00896]|nr:hypothetical protein OG928_03005 [Embleya sp. NBC_00896]